MSLPAIANVTAVVFSGNTRIDWTGTGDSYGVRWRDDSGVWSAELAGSDTGIDIAGLTAGTHYDFEVVTEIDGIPPKIPGGASEADYYGYVPPQGLTVPTDCELVEESATQATISWTGDRTKVHMIEVVDEVGNTDFIEVPIPPGGGTGTITYTITGLDPNMSYVFFIAVTLNDEAIFGDCYIDKSKQCCD